MTRDELLKTKLSGNILIIGGPATGKTTLSKQDGEKSAHMIHELKQIAAVAYRAAKEIESNEIRWI